MVVVAMVRAGAGGAGADADAGGSGGGDCGFDGDIPNTRQYKQLLRGRKTAALCGSMRRRARIFLQ